jgi:hypothetical protein
LALNECCTARIGFNLIGMMPAIDFDDESPRSADEIREVWANGMLAAEFDARQPMCADQFPADPLRLAAVTA